MNIDEQIQFDPRTGNFIQLPVIGLFMADRTVVADERPVTLHWETENAYEVFLNNKVVRKKGSQQFLCNKTSDFSLIATTESGFAVKRELRIEVDNRPPLIGWFRIDTEIAIQGTPIKLSWDIQGARKIWIDNGVGDVSGVNSKLVTCGEKGIYTISASNHFGLTVQSEAAVTIFPMPLVRGVFVPAPVFNLKLPVIASPMHSTLRLNFDTTASFLAQPLWLQPASIHFYGEKKSFDSAKGTKPFFMPGGRR